MNYHTEAIKSGFKRLDEITGGFFPSEFTIIGSRVGFGKTSFVLDIIKNICMNMAGRPLLFSIEMPKETVVQRILAKLSGESTYKIRTGSVDDKAAVIKAKSRMADFSLEIIDTPDIKIDDLVELATKYVQEKNCNIIFIDYIGLIRTDKEDFPWNEQISKISRTLKLLARKLNVPVVVTSQMVRRTDDSEPTLSQLVGYEVLEEVADVITFVTRQREDARSKQKGQLIVAKNHNGYLDIVDAYFDVTTCSFVENHREFKDVLLLDGRGIQKLLKEIDFQDLAKALLGADREVQEKFFQNLSTREAAILKEDMEFMGSVPLDIVLFVQEKISRVLRRLEDADEVILPVEFPSGEKLVKFETRIFKSTEIKS